MPKILKRVGKVIVVPDTNKGFNYEKNNDFCSNHATCCCNKRN